MLQTRKFKSLVVTLLAQTIASSSNHRPSTSTRSSSTLPSSSHLNRLHNRQLPQLPEPARREPPPPYWEHHNHHRIINYSQDDDSSTSSEDSFRYAREEHLEYNAYCPDLVRNCNPAPSTTDVPSSSTRDQSSNQDYVDIDELQNVYAQLNINNNNNTDTKETHRVRKHEISALTSEQEVMGQSLSLRRPKLSLTWVLRDQQRQQREQQLNQQQQQDSQNNNPMRTSFKEKKKKSRDTIVEKLFNEKYVTSASTDEPSKSSVIIPSPSNVYVAPLTAASAAPPTLSQNRIKGNFIPKTVEKTASIKGNRKSVRTKNKFERNKTNENVSSNQSELGLKNTYSEPSLYAASDGGLRKHRQRKRRERNRSQRFGYEIKNVDEFLSKCSLTSPANIPVVLSSASTLYQTRPGGYQIEIPLPLGMVVNAVFKNQNWLYVQTPHAEEGYVGYTSCLPLGILPPTRSSPTARPPPCWENSGDVFPQPCGNMTDSEKELQLRGGTRSEGARTPRLRRVRMCNEKNVDALYLRAASQPKLTEKCYAQLKPTNKYKLSNNPPSSIAASEKSNDNYISVQPRFRPHRPLPPAMAHIHNNNNNNNSSNNNPNVVPPPKPLRQTLLAITDNYESNSVSVKKGDVVILIACKENNTPTEKQQWFYVRTRENAIGFIPAEIAGNGFL